VRGVEIHADSARRTKERLASVFAEHEHGKALAERLTDLWLVEADFLLSDMRPRFTHVVGNPPYVAPGDGGRRPARGVSRASLRSMTGRTSMSRSWSRVSAFSRTTGNSVSSAPTGGRKTNTAALSGNSWHRNTAWRSMWTWSARRPSTPTSSPIRQSPSSRGIAAPPPRGSCIVPTSTRKASQGLPCPCAARTTARTTPTISSADPNLGFSTRRRQEPASSNIRGCGLSRKTRGGVRARNVAKRTPDAWYRTVDRIYPDLARRPKLLVPDIKGGARVVFEEGWFYPHHNFYFIVSSSWDPRALQTVLGSGVAD